MTRVLVVVVVAALASIARADKFEARAQGAVAMRRLDDVVWAATAACDKGDDTQQRQCRQIRDRKAKALAGVPLLVDGDAAALAVGTWNAAKKSVPVSLVGCVSCGGLAVDGKTWVVTNAQPRVDGGKVRGAVLYDNARQFPDEAAAAAWIKSVAGARVQFVVKLADKRQALGDKTDLVVDIVAWRVWNPCDGSIVIASGDAQPLPASSLDKKACAK